MAVIKKKMWPEDFEAAVSGVKKCDFRLGDVPIQAGDVLVLEEWDPKTKAYTGRKLEQRVTWVKRFSLNDTFWPEEEIKKHGLQIISFE